MNLTDKQINTFFDTLVQIIEDRENVKINYTIKNIKGSEKDKNERKNN